MKCILNHEEVNKVQSLISNDFLMALSTKLALASKIYLQTSQKTK